MGNRARPDFCGGSALGPISLFIENILGFHIVDAQNKRIEWRIPQAGKHGINNLRFSDIVSIITDMEGEISVSSNMLYTLVVNGVIKNIKSGHDDIQI